MFYQSPPAAEYTEVLDLHHSQQIVALLVRKWTRELGNRLIRELWARSGAKIAVHFACERHASVGNRIRSRRNEKGKFGANRLMKHRLACISDFPIDEPDRMMHWGRRSSRAADHSAPFHFSSELKSKRRLE
jgi:nuclear transport factor 2 (NTF2) superfamily protein